MPLYDRKCADCAWVALDVWERVSMPLVVCPDCGAPTHRAWLTKASAVIGDEIDITQVNGAKDPIRFRSRLERQRWLKANGYREVDKQVGTSKSARIMDPYTLEAGRYLVMHRQMIDAAEEPDAPLDIRWLDEDTGL